MTWEEGRGVGRWATSNKTKAARGGRKLLQRTNHACVLERVCVDEKGERKLASEKEGEGRETICEASFAKIAFVVNDGRRPVVPLLCPLLAAISMETGQGVPASQPDFIFSSLRENG